VKECFDEVKRRYHADALKFCSELEPEGSINPITLYAIATYKVTHGKEEKEAYVDSWDNMSIVTDDDDPDWEDIPRDELEEGEIRQKELHSFPWLWFNELCAFVKGPI
jgi:hypothetical protein